MGREKGHIVTEETRRKMSKSHKKVITPEFRLKMRNINLGKKVSEETKKKLSKYFKENPSFGFKGKHHTKETIEKIRKHTFEQFKNGMPSETREKIRNKKIEYVIRQRCNGQPIMPTVGKLEKPILDYFENIWGYEIVRQKRVAGYFLDGYCPMLHLAIEIDETYHHNKEKDEIRKQDIINAIGCNFISVEV